MSTKRATVGALIGALAIGGVVFATTSSATEQVTLCHAAGLDGTTQYVTITVGYPAAFGPAGHFDENGTPNAGHEQDYLGACLPDGSTSSSSSSSVPPTTECPDCTPSTLVITTTTTAGDPEPTTTTVPVDPPTIIPPVVIDNPAGIPATGAAPVVAPPKFTG